MNGDNKEDTKIYKVVVNHEEQYSIWSIDQENPIGWRDAGKSGSKQECLEYIKEIWVDMRPLSLRKNMRESAPSTPHDQSRLELEVQGAVIPGLRRSPHSPSFLNPIGEDLY